MNPSSRRLDAILASAGPAAALLARLAAARRAGQAIAPLCAELSPGFDPGAPGACDVRERVLVLWPSSAAQCSKLRQSVPRLLARLQAEGMEVNEIKVVVQPGRIRAGALAKPRKSTGTGHAGTLNPVPESENLAGIGDFSRKLALALPNSPVGAAAGRLAAAVRARLARIRESDQSFGQQDHEENDATAQRQDKGAPRPIQVAAAPGPEVQAGTADHDHPEHN